MNQTEPVEKARQYARMRYTGESERIVLEHETQIFEMREKMAASGMLMSSSTVRETARIHASQIEELTWARLDAILEGYELHQVEVDDQMAINICDEIIQGTNNLIYSAKKPNVPGLPAGSEQLYQQMIQKYLAVSANLVKTKIDRRRLMARKNDSPTTNYYVQGENARVNINSTDHSVNIVMKSTEEFFGAIRQQIESGVSDGEQKRKIVEALAALQESHDKPSFAQRYTDFIAIAADYVTLLTPFIPQLTQMLGQVLK